MIEILSLPFMQSAIIAALVTGLLSPAVGTYIVQRRLSLLGDGLGHVAAAGVGLAIMTGTAPLPAALIVCVTAAVLIELLRQNGKASGDVGLAIMFYGGLAGGVLMAGVAGQGTGALSQYLFGSLLTVSRTDLIIIGVLAVVVIVAGIGLSPQLFAVCADEEFARTEGLRVRALNLIIVVLAALTVTMSMRTVGLMLVSAMMVIPVATAQNLFGGFRATLLGAMGIGAVVAFSGTIGSAWLDTPSGATIIMATIAIFLVSLPFSTLIKRRQVAAAKADAGVPYEASHVMAEPHDHLDTTGREAVLHRDHVDYLHDGHRHAPHDDHFDEH